MVVSARFGSMDMGLILWWMRGLAAAEAVPPEHIGCAAVFKGGGASEARHAIPGAASASRRGPANGIAVRGSE